MKINVGSGPFDYRRKIGFDIEFEKMPRPSMLTFDLNLWRWVVWLSVEWHGWTKAELADIQRRAKARADRLADVID